ncbi:hypothetical protein GO730_21290 [Spirosoma sp. HMF3257]|uniref:Uncharacterized protein n=1 Tax=Spirosoma telluris TaxID=2183553 RepID=A0A327NMQ1_9BACT|nr:hypothetical protein [Spirosoma telluris]RAI76073.1 hypothetical protein HMF3257_21215 [Spirosoma telluris]
MEQQPSKYDFIFVGGARNSYTFITDLLITYEIQFKPTPYLFGEEFVLANEIVELVIKVADNPTGRRPPLDSLIAPTVAAIINDFYQKSSLTITIFICDTADRKHEARWRKFNRWYDHFAATDYVRIDDAFRDPKEELLYHCALIAKRANPYLREVGLAFLDLMADFRADK